MSDAALRNLATANSSCDYCGCTLCSADCSLRREEGGFTLIVQIYEAKTGRWLRACGKCVGEIVTRRRSLDPAADR